MQLSHSKIQSTRYQQPTNIIFTKKLPMINQLLGGGGKPKMMFGGVCILAGLIVFVLFDSLKHSRVSIFGVEILYYMTHKFGRYGFSAIYIVGGLIIGLWGFLQHKNNKPSDMGLRDYIEKKKGEQ
jgi:hypothetical protein